MSICIDPALDRELRTFAASAQQEEVDNAKARGVFFVFCEAVGVGILGIAVSTRVIPYLEGFFGSARVAKAIPTLVFFAAFLWLARLTMTWSRRRTEVILAKFERSKYLPSVQRI